MTEIYGYARVSTRDQNEERQVIALKNVGVVPANLIVEKRSGKDFNRPMWTRLVRKLKRGDILVIKSIDRLGRNYNEIIDVWRILVKDKGVHIKVIDMPLLDTTVSQGLMAEFIANLVLQILSFVAQSERESIKTRQREGIEAAKARGVQFGRPTIAKPSNFNELAKQVLSKALSLTEAAQQAAVSRTTFRRWLASE